MDAIRETLAAKVRELEAEVERLQAEVKQAWARVKDLEVQLKLQRQYTEDVARYGRDLF